MIQFDPKLEDTALTDAVEVVGLNARGLYPHQIAELVGMDEAEVVSLLESTKIKPQWIPTPRDIDNRSRAIRERWNARERVSRAGGVRHWTLPEYFPE